MPRFSQNSRIRTNAFLFRTVPLKLSCLETGKRRTDRDMRYLLAANMTLWRMKLGLGILAVMLTSLQAVRALSFGEAFDVLWAIDRTSYKENGIELRLDWGSGSGFGSRDRYLYGSFSARIKLPKNSAGVLTTFYLSSGGNKHDELDFEFLGNVSGQPITLQTNVFANGKGEREQRVNLWFDPSDGYHSYALTWNPHQIIFWVETTPIRVFRNIANKGLSYPTSQPMRLFSSMFDASDWATRGGQVKIDWKYSPFVGSYNEFALDACKVAPWESVWACQERASSQWWSTSLQWLNSHQIDQLKWVRNKHMVYDYCSDSSRNPTPPTECKFNVP